MDGIGCIAGWLGSWQAGWQQWIDSDFLDWILHLGAQSSVTHWLQTPRDVLTLWKISFLRRKLTLFGMWN